MTRMLPWLIGVALISSALPARAESAPTVARAVRVATRLEAFARVEPVSLLRLKAVRTGVLTGFEVLPGEMLAAGEVLGRLAGPEVEAFLAARRGAVVSARAACDAAREVLGAASRKRAARLNTQADVSRAEAALASARSVLADARSQLRAATAALTLRAPVAGTVLELESAAGERVEAGQTLLVLQPAGALWLRAVYFGAEATEVRVGMRGRFAPVDGGAAVPVKVRTVIGALSPGGGRQVGLVPTGSAPGWRSGAAGTLILDGPERTLAAVPSRALILDAGRWWVLVRTGQGDRPQAVVPGPVRGGTTLIERGLEPGAEIVVENAYLEFHRDFSRHYQPPD